MAIALGNDYQVLDWLENGLIDAAVVSPFAASLVRRQGANSQARLFRMTRSVPFSSSPLESYRVGLTIELDGQLATDPAAAFDAIMASIASGDTSGIIRGKNYLHPAFRALLGYAEQRFSELPPGTAAEADTFWKSFIDLLTFGDADTEQNGEGYDFVINVETADAARSPAARFLDISVDGQTTDVFIYNRRFSDILWGNTPPAAFSPSTGGGMVGEWLRGRNAVQDGEDGHPLLQFMHDNYRVEDIGSRQHRHFRFALPELLDILRAENGRSGAEAPFGLILTGGGVKAAYQTRIVEELYGQGFLSNVPGSETSNFGHAPIVVDHIVGTSGGALLGIFVSALDGKPVGELTNSLWRTGDGGRYIESYDVFPWLEMPRYLSGVWSLIIFSVLGTAFYALVAVVRKQFPGLQKITLLSNLFSENRMPEEYTKNEKSSRTVPPGFVWVVLLFAAPWIIKFVIRDGVLEHVPAITGVFYMLCALIAVYSDNRVIANEQFRWASVSLSMIEVLVLVLGLALIVLPLFVSLPPIETRDLNVVFGRQINGGTLLTCIGLSIAFLMLHRAVSKNTSRVVLVDQSLHIKAAGLLVMLVAVPQIGLFFTGRPTHELTVGFWGYVTLYSLVTALAVLLIGHLPGWQRKNNFVRDVLDYFHSAFPRRTYFVNLERGGRITVFLGMSFVYWNLVMAPAIYGNASATEYFVDTYTRSLCVDDSNTTAECRNRLASRLSWTPSTKFVMSATSLEGQRERYYLFHPRALDRSRCPVDSECQCPEIDAIDSGALIELESLDRRWRIVGCDVTDAQIIEVAFSSGSPFPVFPANEVDINGARERLVDGGYAHNMPIEASVNLGANRALVISSSPLHQHEVGSIRETIWRPGFLFLNLQRLFPYLFSRSQVEDLLSAQGLLVATISPIPRSDWPLLTDFQGRTIEYLVDEANKDLDRRIGMIESWGSPTCMVRQNAYSCRELNDVL